MGEELKELKKKEKNCKLKSKKKLKRNRPMSMKNRKMIQYPLSQSGSGSLTTARSLVRDFDVLLHTAGEQSQLTWRAVRLSVSTARRSTTAGLVGVSTADHRRVTDASGTSRIGHTRSTVPAVQV